MATTIDREEMKKALRNLVKTDMADFRKLITEVIEEAKADIAVAERSVQKGEAADRSEIDRLIEAHFERFDDVFRALA